MSTTPTRRPVTIREVAAAAGVSPKTVSNVVNEYVHVHPDTRRRVQEAIDALGYRPSAVGRQLRSGRTGMIALAVPNIAAPYFAELGRHVATQARRRGLVLAVEQTEGLLEREREVADGQPVRFADGLLLSALEMPDDELAAPHPDTPLVLIGEHGGPHLPVDRVGIDSAGVARTAVEHLIACGRTRIAFLGHKAPVHNSARQRTAGYRAALDAAGLPFDAELVPPCGDWSRADGHATTARLLRERPDTDAVFAANDELALGALAALREAGRSVPADVSVVGVDDVPEARFSWPALSTVAIDRAFVAERAVELLTSRLSDPGLPPRHLQTPYRLVVRESSRPDAGRSPGAGVTRTPQEPAPDGAAGAVAG
ncbi:LacI family DNA-binding transcriptional regulator [Quadrisphaera sp. KR29]|uniref:LacI family DNA-binding transcriptional regulator n=1 Tax=Quadrisphaera sp. KR29 TaxID=3461391 RepID=UPI004043C1AF